MEKFEINQDIEVIYNFIDPDRFKRLNKDHFRKAIAPNGEKILIHTSNFRKVKRVGDAIKVFAKMREKMECKLILIGDGPERPAMEELCRDIGLCDEIRFLGKQDAVEEILAIGDLFILPSQNESFGLAALEAMACELPVISTNIGGLPEVNTHGETGFLFDVGDVDGMANSAIQLLSNPTDLAKMKENAFNRSQEFKLEKILEKYIDLYEKVIKMAPNDKVLS